VQGMTKFRSCEVQRPSADALYASAPASARRRARSEAREDERGAQGGGHALQCVCLSARSASQSLAHALASLFEQTASRWTMSLRTSAAKRWVAADSKWGVITELSKGLCLRARSRTALRDLQGTHSYRVHFEYEGNPMSPWCVPEAGSLCLR
jgi:hypothetical protein